MPKVISEKKIINFLDKVKLTQSYDWIKVDRKRDVRLMYGFLNFNEHLKKIEEKSKNKSHTTLTPLNVCAKMVNKLYVENKFKPDSKVLVICNPEFVQIVRTLYKYLGYDTNNIYYIDYNEERVKMMEKFCNSKYFYLKDLNLNQFNMKFDVILMNPPYGNLHLQFVEKSVALLTETGVSSVIHPAGNWLHNQFPEKAELTKKKFNKHVKSVEIVGENPFVGIELGYCLSYTTLVKDNKKSISVFDRTCDYNYTVSDLFDINKFGPIGNSIVQKVIKNKKDDLKNNLVSKSNKKYFIHFPVYINGFSGYKTAYSFNAFLFYVHGGIINVKNCIRTEVGDGCLSFDTLEEAENCRDYLKTYFARFCLSICKSDLNIEAYFKLVPYMDFSRKWTDKDLFEYFDLTAEEQEHIYKHIPKYYEE